MFTKFSFYINSYGKKKRYRIDQIDWDSTTRDTFENKKGGAIMSFLQYFEERYNVQIRAKNQPMLIAIPKLTAKQKANGITQPPAVRLIPELCLLIEPILPPGLEKQVIMQNVLDNIIVKLSTESLSDTIGTRSSSRKELVQAEKWI
jgi:hypothetical protein